MRLRISAWLFLLGLLITSCGGGNNLETEATDTADAGVQISTSNTSASASLEPDVNQLTTNCTVVSRKPTPGPTQESLFPPVNEHDWIKGATDAEITLIEYSDFQCPQCARLAPVLAQILNEFPEQVRIVYRHYPLIGTPEEPFHDKAAMSTQAAEAAGRQGLFWEMHDLLFAKQNEWIDLSINQYEEWLVEQASELALDVEQFSRDLTSEELVQYAQDAWDINRQIGIPGTPFLLNNGQIWQNIVPMDLWGISAVIKMTLLVNQQYTSCPPIVIDTTKQYIATLETEKGNIVLELYPLEAPLAVNSFVFLARNDWFDNITFHRVRENFVAQAGDPTGTGFGGPGYAFANEISENLSFDKPGVLAMANAGADSNGSQFFITYTPQPRLDGDYTIFGQLIDGMDVLKSLTLRNPSENIALPPGDKIFNVIIQEK